MKDSFPDPRGLVTLATRPQVIASVNKDAIKELKLTKHVHLLIINSLSKGLNREQVLDGNVRSIYNMFKATLLVCLHILVLLFSGSKSCTI